MFPHEPQNASLKFHAVFDGLRDIAACGVWTQYISMLGKPSASMPR